MGQPGMPISAELVTTLRDNRRTAEVTLVRLGARLAPAMAGRRW